MLKRFLCLALCVLLLPVAAATAETTFSMAGYDGEDSNHDWETNQFFARMQERTGISFTFQEYKSSSDWQKAKEQMFATGELPDVLFKASLTSEELIRYTDSGQLIDLKPLLEENAPHLWALLTENPDWMEAITLPNGKIGALPAIHSASTQDVLWINQTWLNNLGLDMPTDRESLKQVLIAFRDKDPNQNNKKDEIPLGFLGPWELKFLSSAFGVVVNDYNIYLAEDGTVHFWPDEDSFFELAAWLKELYAEGLLDPNGFYTSDVLRRSTDSKSPETYGVFFAPSPLNIVTYDQATDYTILAPLAYEGQQIYRDLCGTLTRGTFAITSACSDPAALLQWVDILYTEEGAIEAMLGKEGDMYIINEDNQWQWKGGVDKVTSSQLYELSIYDSGEMPWLFPQDFYSRYAEQSVTRMTQEMADFAVYLKEPFPTTYTLTLEENAELRPLQSDLGRCVDESLARFVLGETDLNDDTIAEFRQTIREKGMQEMIDFWQRVALRTQE